MKGDIFHEAMLTKFHTLLVTFLKTLPRFSLAPFKMSTSYLIHISLHFSSLTLRWSRHCWHMRVEEDRGFLPLGHPLPSLPCTFLLVLVTENEGKRERERHLASLLVESSGTLHVWDLTAALPYFLEVQKKLYVISLD